MSASGRFPAGTGPLPSSRDAGLTIDEVAAEIAATNVTERGKTRADDRVTEAAMEDRKRVGLLLSATDQTVAP